MMNTTPTLKGNPKTWILVTHGSGAQLFESDGGVKNLHRTQSWEHPEGRLHNRDIESDDSGARPHIGARGGGRDAANLGRSTPVNKNEATFHLMQQFARSLAETVNKGRTGSGYDRLVLVGEERFLGELKLHLAPGAAAVAEFVPKELVYLSEKDMTDRLTEILRLKS